MNFRANAKLWQRLQAVSDGLNVDMANLVRMIVTKHLADYEAEVDALQRRERKGDT